MLGRGTPKVLKHQSTHQTTHSRLQTPTDDRTLAPENSAASEKPYHWGNTAPLDPGKREPREEPRLKHSLCPRSSRPESRHGSGHTPSTFRQNALLFNEGNYSHGLGLFNFQTTLNGRREEAKPSWERQRWAQAYDCYQHMTSRKEHWPRKEKRLDST